MSHNARGMRPALVISYRIITTQYKARRTTSARTLDGDRFTPYLVGPFA
jgi:hypothetical protein